MRLEFYVGERDLFGIGFSDNVIFRKQYYIRVVASGAPDLSESLDQVELYLYSGRELRRNRPRRHARVGETAAGRSRSREPASRRRWG